MLHEVSFASYNGRDQVQGWIYVPACKPKGIVQVIHGFGEHSRRYLHMISALHGCGLYRGSRRSCRTWEDSNGQ